MTTELPEIDAPAYLRLLADDLHKRGNEHTAKMLRQIAAEYEAMDKSLIALVNSVNSAKG